MIIIRLMGGLGNQMFQFALGRELAYRWKTSLKLDISSFQAQSLRSYQLDAFRISAEIASSGEVARFNRTNLDRLRGKVYRAYQQYLPYYHRRLIMEKELSFDPNIVDKVRQDAYLSGYWQSEKYFKPIEAIIREEFQLNRALSPGGSLWAGKILSCNSVSLHVRRGDYASDTRKNPVHGVCSIEYYQKAINYFEEHITGIKLFVFSDDLSWARQNLNNFSSIHFVEIESESRDTEELTLLSYCKHHIIANSSFSWWGAWLGTHPTKLVIAPEKWFNDPNLHNKDLIPESWVRL